MQYARQLVDCLNITLKVTIDDHVRLLKSGSLEPGRYQALCGEIRGMERAIIEAESTYKKLMGN